MLFGDGAGAIVVEAQKLNGVLTDRGVLAVNEIRRPLPRQTLCRWRPSSTSTVEHVRMDGPKVFRHAVTKISEVIGQR